jgi:hypothetical protein
LHRHRIEHLVADEDATQPLRQRVDPAHFRAMRRQPLGLPLAQARRQVDDGVARHRLAQRIEQLQRERARAGAELPDLVGPGGLQRLRNLARQRAAEQGREFRRGDEVAAR